MLKRIWRTLMHSEWKLSLWQQLFGAGGLVSSFGLGAWAASASAWLDAWGPVGWVFAGFLGAGSFALILFGSLSGYAYWRDRVARARLVEERSKDSSRINILHDQFTKEVIEVRDLFSPFNQIIRDKTFKECRFSGPMVVAFIGSSRLSGMFTAECNYIVLGNGPLAGVVVFDSCTFLQCSFDCVTFLLQENTARELRKASERDGVPVFFHGIPFN